MLAAYYTGNRTFKIKEKPLLPPKDNEVAVGIDFCGICGTDLHVFHGVMDKRVGLNRILGHEMSGKIKEIGSQVQGLSIGQKVVVRPLLPCGICPACKGGHSHICHNLKFLGLDTDGAMQTQWNVPAETIHVLPGNIQKEHAALIEPLAVACHDVSQASLKKNEDVLIIGGGPIGVLIALVAKQIGANVIIAEINLARLKLIQKLGFETINPMEVSLSESIHNRTKGKGADVVFEVSGSEKGVDAMTECTSTGGRIVMVGIHSEKRSVDLFRFFWRELKLIGVRVYKPEDYEKAIHLVTTKSIDLNPIITDIKPLSEIQNAFESLDSNPSALKTLIQIN